MESHANVAHATLDQDNNLQFPNGDVFTESNAKHSLTIMFDSKALAEHFALAFPKFCKARVGKITCYDTRTGCYQKDSVSLNVSVATNKVTGEVNETGLRRRNRTLAILTELNLYK